MSSFHEGSGTWVLCRKAHRADVAELAVGTRVVVVLAEVGDDHPRLGECPKRLLVEALVAEAAMEAFHAAVLPGAAWIDVEGFDLLVSQRAWHFLGDGLRAVVAPQQQGCTVFLAGAFQPGEHVGGPQKARSGRRT